MKISIERETYPEHPRRDVETLGTIVASRAFGENDLIYKGLPECLSHLLSEIGVDLSDKFWEMLEEDQDPAAIGKAREIVEKRSIILPVYLFDHSGVSVSTRPFLSSWDSGQVGFVYVTVQTAKEVFGWDRLTAKRRKNIEKILKSEIKVLDQYLNGDVWGYTIEDDKGDILDACWGIYGREHCEQAAQEALSIL